MNEREQAKIFKALASEPRLKILRLLREHPQCVNAITARLKMTQPTVSLHLRLLKEAGLVKAEKRGIWMHYALDPAAAGRQGISLAGIFEGQTGTAQPVKGTLNCPPPLLKECQKKPVPELKPKPKR
jgi:DNA-binding transcriptional ArsR family regulator